MADTDIFTDSTLFRLQQQTVEIRKPPPTESFAHMKVPMAPFLPIRRPGPGITRQHYSIIGQEFVQILREDNFLPELLFSDRLASELFGTTGALGQV
jgi:hypothetical protein